jgi:hypothetical protein
MLREPFVFPLFRVQTERLPTSPTASSPLGVGSGENVSFRLSQENLH